MKYLVFGICLGITLCSCTPMKRAQTGLARSIAGSEMITVDGHEVYCSQGSVCSEIDVLSIWVEQTESPGRRGKVLVTFKNRTGNTALFQVRLQIKDPGTGELITETRPENVSIPPTQEINYERRGVYVNNAKVRVILNTAY